MSSEKQKSKGAGSGGELWLIDVPASFIKRFRSRCRETPGGCLIYDGGRTVRLPIDVDAEVEFVTPRRASYLIGHGQLPTHEIKLSCQTDGCVNREHFVEGRPRQLGTTMIDDAIATDIRNETGLSEYAVARKYGVSRNTIRRITGKKAGVIKADIKTVKHDNRLYRF